MSPVPVPGGFSDVKVSDFEPLPSGTYDAKIVKCEFQDAREETATKYEAEHDGAKHPGVIACEFDIMDEAYANRKQWATLTLRPDKLGQLKGFLLAVGYEEEAINAADFQFEPTDAVGQNIRLKIRPDRDREGQTRVVSFMSASDNLLP